MLRSTTPTLCSTTLRSGQAWQAWQAEHALCSQCRKRCHCEERSDEAISLVVDGRRRTADSKDKFPMLRSTTLRSGQAGQAGHALCSQCRKRCHCEERSDEAISLMVDGRRRTADGKDKFPASLHYAPLVAGGAGVASGTCALLAMTKGVGFST